MTATAGRSQRYVAGHVLCCISGPRRSKDERSAFLGGAVCMRDIAAGLEEHSLGCY